MLVRARVAPCCALCCTLACSEAPCSTFHILFHSYVPLYAKSFAKEGACGYIHAETTAACTAACTLASPAPTRKHPSITACAHEQVFDSPVMSCRRPAKRQSASASAPVRWSELADIRRHGKLRDIWHWRCAARSDDCNRCNCNASTACSGRSAGPLSVDALRKVLRTCSSHPAALRTRPVSGNSRISASQPSLNFLRL